MKKILATLILFSSVTSVFADSFNSVSVQGQLISSVPIYNVNVHILSAGSVVGTASDIALVPDADGIFSTQTYITNPWVFQTGSDYTMRLSTGGYAISTFSITAVPFALTVRGDAQTGNQNIFGAYGNVGIGTSTPTYRLVVSSGGSNLLWVSSDGVHAAKYYGDGASLTGIVGTGDNMGSHVATKTLDMAGYNIDAAGEISATEYKQGSDTLLVMQGDENLYLGIGASPDGPPYGSANTSVGNDSGGWSTVDQDYNSFFGYAAAYNGAGGAENTVLGAVAAGLSGIGSGNTMIGAWAGWDSSGDGNIFIGNNAGVGVRYATSDNNIMIGNDTHMASYDASYKLNIGNLIYGDMAAYTIGIGTETPMAALDVVSTGTANNQFAQIWRDSSGVIISSMSATGVIMADRFVGDGSGLTNLSLNGGGDNLGSHVATTTLNMSGNQILNVSSLTVTGKDATGYSLSLSSGINAPAGTVTAGLFSGSGASLTALNASNLASGTVADARLSSSVDLLDANQTVSGNKTFTGTIALPTRDKITFGNKIHNSSFTSVAAYSTTQTSFTNCVTGSTVTITTNGGDVAVVFSGSMYNDNAGYETYVSFKQDGQYVSPLSSAIGVTGGTSTNGGGYGVVNGSFRYVITGVSADSHAYCLTLRAGRGGTARFDTGSVSLRFGVEELR